MKLQWPVKSYIGSGVYLGQKFAQNFRDYGALHGHPGLDIIAPMNRESYFPSDGYLYEVANRTDGYGRHVKYWFEEDGLQYIIVLGHYEKVVPPVGFYGFSKTHPVNRGQLVGYVGSTGYSNAPHIHLGKYQYKNNILQNSGNGYGGALDPLPDLLPETDFKIIMNQAKVIKSKKSPSIYICYEMPDMDYLQKKANIEGFAIPTVIPDSDSL